MNTKPTTPRLFAAATALALAGSLAGSTGCQSSAPVEEPAQATKADHTVEAEMPVVAPEAVEAPAPVEAEPVMPAEPVKPHVPVVAEVEARVQEAVAAAMPGTQVPPFVEALNAAPANATILVVIPSLQEASDAIADLAEFVEADDDKLLDLLGSVKREIGFGTALDDDGPGVIVFDDSVFDAGGMGEDPVPLLLVPVTDYAAFAEALGGTSQGVSEVTLNADQGFIRPAGRFAVLAESREAIEAFTPGQRGDELLRRSGRFGAAAADDAVAAVFVDLAAMRPMLSDAIDDGLGALDDAIEQDLQAQPDVPFSPKLIQDLMGAYGDAGQMLLNGVDGLLVTLNSDEQGVRIKQGLTLVPGSKLSGFFTDQRGDAQGLLASVPSMPYLFAATVDTQAMDIGGMGDAVLNRMQELLEDQPAFAGLVEAIRPSLDMYRDMDAAAQVFYAPDMASLMSGGVNKTLSVYRTPDPEAAVAAWRQSFEAMPGVITDLLDELSKLNEEAGMLEGFAIEVDWTESAINLNGVDVHEYRLSFVLPDELMMQMGPGAMMMGQAGPRGYIGHVGDKVLMTTVVDAPLMSAGIKAVEAQDGLGTQATIATAREDLPTDVVWETFVSLDGLANAANPFLIMTGMSAGLEVPENVPPIAVGVGLQGQSIGASWIVPMDTMRFVKDTIEGFQDEQSQDADTGGGQRPPF